MKDFEKQRAFLKALQGLVRLAQKNGNMVTQEQISSAFSGMELSDDQLQQVRDYLASNQIGTDSSPETPAGAGSAEADDLLQEEDHNYLNDYMETVSAIEMPTAGQLDAVKLSSMAGEKDAQGLLAQYMLAKVVDIARLYAGQGVFMEDLIGVGNLALMQGVALLAPLDSPDEVEGALADRIMGAMEDLVAQNIEAKAADQDAVSMANKVLEAADKLAEMAGRKVSVAELVQEGEVTYEEIMEALRLTGWNIDSLETSSEGMPI